MTPQEALTFIQGNAKFPAGIKATLVKDRIIIGNDYGHMALSGDLLLNEETIILTIDKSLPSLQEAINQTFAEKKAAEELDRKLKADHRSKIMRKKK